MNTQQLLFLFVSEQQVKHCFRLSLRAKPISVCISEQLFVDTCQANLCKFYIRLQLRMKLRKQYLRVAADGAVHLRSLFLQPELPRKLEEI